jgi:hypothetical protein
MSAWPKPKTIAAGVSGRVAEVWQTERGPVRVVRSADPKVLLVLSATPHAACFRCNVYAPAPDGPTSRGLNGKPEQILAPGTDAHALHLLTWLYNFSAAHMTCPEGVSL